MENSKSVQPESKGSKPWLPFTIGFTIGFLAGALALGTLLILYLWVMRVAG